MADLIYDYGLDEWRTWTTDTFTWLALTSSYAPSRLHHFVADVAANEVAVAGYARVTATGKTRTVDTTAHRIIYDCANPAFGAPVAGATIGFVALARTVTDDTDSVLVALYDITDVVTDTGEFTPLVAAGGAHYVDQGT